MATNKPVFYRSLAEIGRRIPDAPQWNGDSFVTGCNRGVANGAIGINTGDYDPKETDFSRDVARWATPASYIGHYDQAVADMEDRMVGLILLQPILLLLRITAPCLSPTTRERLFLLVDGHGALRLRVVIL